MITQKQFLQKEIDMGIGFHNPQFVELCKGTTNMIAELNGIETILDYGGGTGVYTKAFLEAGYKVVYYDLWKVHIEYAKKHIEGLNVCKKPISTDLMLFIEVAEHMTDDEIKELFKQIRPDYILFSSTSTHFDGDEEWGHINVKPQEKWLELFERIGYTLYRECILPTTWSKILKRK